MSAGFHVEEGFHCFKKKENKQTKPQTLTTFTQNMNNLLEFCHQDAFLGASEILPKCGAGQLWVCT